MLLLPLSCNKVCEHYIGMGWCSGLAQLSVWLAKEGRDEDTGVQIECGMPPPIRKVQHLGERGTKKKV